MGYFQKIILFVMLSNTLSTTSYAIIAPFLPFEYERKQIDQSIFGYIFSSYSVAVIIGSPFIGKIMNIYGRRNMIFLGLILMGMSFLGFSLFAYIKSPNIIIGLSFCFRIIQGFASSCIQTTCYSICTTFFPERKEELIGQFEACVGFGLIIGPVVGSVLYELGGFTFTFITVSTSFFILAFFVNKLMPNRFDQSQFKDTFVNHQISHQDQFPFKKRKIGYLELLSNRRFTLAAISGSFGYFLYCFMEPILALRLEEFKLGQLMIGLFFAILPVTYIIASIYAQYLPKGIQKRAILISTIAFAFVSNLCVGPSQLFRFPDSLLIMAIGQALLGLVDPLMLIPSLPEMIESVIDDYPDQESEVNNLSSAVFNSFLGIGQVAGPIYGSLATKYFNFRIACDFAAIISLTFAIIYFIIGNGWSAFKVTRSKKIDNVGN